MVSVGLYEDKVLVGLQARSPARLIMVMMMIWILSIRSESERHLAS